MEWTPVFNDGRVVIAPNMEYCFDQTDFHLRFEGTPPFSFPIRVSLGGKAAETIQSFQAEHPEQFAKYLLVPAYCIGTIAEMLAVLLARYIDHREMLNVYGGLICDSFIEMLHLRVMIEKGPSLIILPSHLAQNAETPEVYGKPLFGKTQSEEAGLVAGIAMAAENPIRYRVEMLVGLTVAETLCKMECEDPTEFNRFFDLASHSLGAVTEVIYFLIEKKDHGILTINRPVNNDNVFRLVELCRRLIEQIMPLERTLVKA